MEHPKYKIETVQDMLDCTNEENLDRFLADLRYVLKVAHNTRNLAIKIGEIKGLPKSECIMEFPSYQWIDDGKHEKAAISIGVIEEEE